MPPDPPPSPAPDELQVSDLKPAPLKSAYTYKCPLLCSRFTQGALLVSLSLSLVNSAFYALQIGLIFLDEQGKATPPFLWDLNSLGHDHLGQANLPVFLLTAIFFSRWLYRVASNAITLNPRKITDTPAMSIIWYFVPFANLVMPYQNMKAIDAVSSSHGYFSTSRLLPWWWALWLLTRWIEQIFVFVWAEVETNAEIMKVSIFYESTFLADCALTLLAMTLVRRITSAQRLHHDPAFAPPEISETTAHTA